MKAVSLRKRGSQVPVAAQPTDVMELRTLWSTMPGWCTAANLIPPELISARRLAVLRRYMLAGLVVLLALCAGGYVLAARQNAVAVDDLGAVQDRTLQLQQQGRSYSGVLQVQSSVILARQQIAQVMAGDVDLVALMGNLQSNLPKTMTIGQESITISVGSVAGGGATTAALDTSGLPRIGTITLSGTGKALDDLSDYIDRLRTVKGLVDIVPVSNTKSTSGARTQFNLQIGLTNELLSHRFDVTPVTK